MNDDDYPAVGCVLSIVLAAIAWIAVFLALIWANQ
jgi:hypothetical protein